MATHLWPKENYPDEDGAPYSTMQLCEAPYCVHLADEQIRRELDQLEARKQELLAMLVYNRALAPGVRWKCGQCGTLHPVSLDYCTNCGAPRANLADPEEALGG